MGHVTVRFTQAAAQIVITELGTHNLPCAAGVHTLYQSFVAGIIVVANLLGEILDLILIRLLQLGGIGGTFLAVGRSLVCPGLMPQHLGIGELLNKVVKQRLPHTLCILSVSGVVVERTGTGLLQGDEIPFLLGKTPLQRHIGSQVSAVVIGFVILVVTLTGSPPVVMLFQRAAGVVEVTDTDIDACGLTKGVQLLHIVVAEGRANHQHVDHTVITGSRDLIKIPPAHTVILPLFKEFTGSLVVLAVLQRLCHNQLIQVFHHIFQAVADLVTAHISGAVSECDISLGIDGGLAGFFVFSSGTVLGLHNAGDHSTVFGLTAGKAILSKDGVTVFFLGNKVRTGHISSTCHHTVRGDLTL